MSPAWNSPPDGYVEHISLSLAGNPLTPAPPPVFP